MCHDASCLCFVSVMMFARIGDMQILGYVYKGINDGTIGVQVNISNMYYVLTDTTGVSYYLNDQLVSSLFYKLFKSLCWSWSIKISQKLTYLNRLFGLAHYPS